MSKPYYVDAYLLFCFAFVLINFITVYEQIIFFLAHCVGGATAYLAEISIFQDHHAPT